MKSIMARLKEYIEKNILEQNAEKIKIMRFRKGKARKVNKVWRYKGKVKEFKYLGYVLRRNRNQVVQLKDKEGSDDYDRFED